MITAGFTGQLKDWWDNYLNQGQRDKILQVIAANRNPLQVRILKLFNKKNICLQKMSAFLANKDWNFKELSINVIDNDKGIELLQSIKDPDISAQIIDKI
ncbi:hypothetical protein H5410_060503 [Solanum commersonii]|uniref:DUF7746 domain-containing protein n=1 Tax=Solanum commersonii TaxID=4109 RepID=A0A9J5W5L4_SOLCO|nr:hypothetical protein H5410_060503 [Solanum commersonii]